MKKSIKICCASLILAVGLSITMPRAGAYAAERNIKKVITKNKEFVAFNNDLHSALKEEGITQQEWRTYTIKMKTTVTKEPPSRWKISIVKTAGSMSIK